MRRRLAAGLLGVLALVTGLAAPASADKNCTVIWMLFFFVEDCETTESAPPPKPHRLVITASRSARVNYRLGRPVSFDMAKFSVTGGGDYRGVYFEPAGRPAGGFGVLYVPGLSRRFTVDTVHFGDVKVVNSTVTLPAGNYEIHVIGAKTTQVSIVSYDLTADRHVVARVKDGTVAHLDSVPAPNPVGPRLAAVGSRELTVPKSAFVLTATSLAHRGPRAALAWDVDTCLRSDGLPTCQSARRAGSSWTWHRESQVKCNCANDAVGEALFEDGVLEFVTPGGLAAGRYSANATAYTTGSVDDVRTFTFMLPV